MGLYGNGTVVSMNIAELIFVGVKFIHLKSKCFGHSYRRSLGHSWKDLGELTLKIIH